MPCGLLRQPAGPFDFPLAPPLLLLRASTSRSPARSLRFPRGHLRTSSLALSTPYSSSAARRSSSRSKATPTAAIASHGFAALATSPMATARSSISLLKEAAAKGPSGRAPRKWASAMAQSDCAQDKKGAEKLVAGKIGGLKVGSADDKPRMSYAEPPTCLKLCCSGCFWSTVVLCGTITGLLSTCSSSSSSSSSTVLTRSLSGIASNKILSVSESLLLSLDLSDLADLDLVIMLLGPEGIISSEIRVGGERALNPQESGSRKCAFLLHNFSLQEPMFSPPPNPCHVFRNI